MKRVAAVSSHIQPAIGETFASLRSSEEFTKLYQGLFPKTVIVVSYSDASYVLLHHEEFSSKRKLRQTELGKSFGFDPIVWQDPPEHTIGKSSLKEFFTRERFMSLRSWIDETALGIVSGAKKGHCVVDLVAKVTDVLPIMVIMKLLGIPLTECDFIKQTCSVIQPMFTGLATRIQDQQQLLASIGASMGLLRKYFEKEDLVDRIKKGEFSGSFFDHLFQADPSSFNMNVIVGYTLFMAFAGSETSANLMGMMFYDLLGRSRSQWDVLLKDPSLCSDAIEEALRLWSPSTAIARVATVECVLPSGQRIKAGDSVLVVLAAANRDCPNASELIIGRERNPTLAFGGGIHICLGSLLAKLEAEVMLLVMLKTCPNARIVKQCIWKDDVMLRGLQSLAVQLN
jgi:cytochrome P450